jgi:8-oxo-dGTP diphosphatase
MKIPLGVWGVVREVARHLLRRPVVGVAALARTDDDRWVLIRRGDTGQWALPGGTVEWGETLRAAITRELWEEAGVSVRSLEQLSGVYSQPDRDPRFHAVTVVIHARVSMPEQPPKNPVEIREVGLFSDDSLPEEVGMGMKDMLHNRRRAGATWE